MSISPGLRRPPQITEAKQIVQQHHERIRLFDDTGASLKEPLREKIDVYKITIESIDVRLTDVLLRAISAVLHSWQHEVGNAAENVLRECGKWENDAPPEPPVDMNKDITQPPVPDEGARDTSGVGNG